MYCTYPCLLHFLKLEPFVDVHCVIVVPGMKLVQPVGSNFHCQPFCVLRGYLYTFIRHEDQNEIDIRYDEKCKVCIFAAIHSSSRCNKTIKQTQIHTKHMHTYTFIHY